MKNNYKILIGLGVIMVFVIAGVFAADKGLSPASVSPLANPEGSSQTRHYGAGNEANPEGEQSSKSWFLAPPANAQEIVEMRTQNSKTWLKEVLPDGRAKLAWEGQIGAIHYKNNPNDSQELWKDIISDITPSDRKDYDYEMTKAGYNVFFKENFNQGNIVRYEKGGEFLTIAPGPLKWIKPSTDSTSSPQATEQLISNPRDVTGSPMKDKPNHIYWSNAYGGKIDFEWVTEPTRLTKFLIIENFNHLKPLDSRIFSNTDDVYLELNLVFEFSEQVTMTKERGRIELKNKKGETLWGFLPLRYWDSSQPKKEGTLKTRILNSKFITLSLKVPYEWLQNATYPVYIDANVDDRVKTNSDDFYKNSAGIFSISEPNFNAGNNNQIIEEAGARFTSAAIPQGAVINAAYLTLRARISDSSTSYTKIWGQASDDADTFSDLTDYESRPTTVAAVDWDPVAWTKDNDYNSPSIVSIIQKIVDRAGWISGNDLAIFWKDDGSAFQESVTHGRRAYSYDSSSSYAPKLHIEYGGWQPLEKLKIKKAGLQKYAFKTLGGAVIEIGTETHSPPQPYLKLGKWDNEVSLKVKVPYDVAGKPKIVGDKLRYSSNKADIDFYPRQPEEITEIDFQGNKNTFTINEEGGVEFDVILKQKPESNVFEFPIESERLKFYYQPELTQEEIDEGAFRSENVVGSYAVYHESKSGDYSKMGDKNYRAGKAFHIYRPKITDAEGNEIWGELNINEQAGTLTIVVDQNWLDNAVYPVTIDPNFGETSAGASNSGYGSTNVYTAGTATYSPAGDGTLSSMSVYAKDTLGSIYDTYAKLALYDSSDESLVDYTGAFLVDTAAAWYSADVTDSASVAAASSYRMAFKQDGTGVMRIYWDTGVTDDAFKRDANSFTDPFPDPASWTGSAGDDNKFSIYGTYTEGGAAWQPRPAGVQPGGSGGFFMF